MFWLMPHLQAAQRKISAVVPVKRPFTLGAISLLACQVSPLKKWRPMCWPVLRLYLRLTPLFSFIGRDRTHLAHWAPDGSFLPGLIVVKNAGPLAAGLVPAWADPTETRRGASEMAAIAAAAECR